MNVTRRCSGLLLALVLCAPASLALSEREVARILREAKSSAGSVDLQGDALAQLAWPADGQAQRQVASVARDELILFGRLGVAPLRRALLSADERYSADIVAALIICQRFMTEGVAADYLPALEDAVWFGSVDARRLAIHELARHQHRSSMLVWIDSAYEHPALVIPVVRALRYLRDDRARFYLDELLHSDNAEWRGAAADALATIGGHSADVLRAAALEDDEELQSLAMSYMLPVTGVDDLTTLHEFIVRHAEAGGELYERVRQRAIHLEGILERQMAQDSASEGDPDY
ncbi:MAG: hypothetical protein GY716_11250 [bacterium]|nr:hypothetical protein [bacterium]